MPCNQHRVSFWSAGRAAGKGSAFGRLGAGELMACRAEAWWARTGGATRYLKIPDLPNIDTH
eukprot:297867-Pyramimonas_sp.AAC.1